MQALNYLLFCVCLFVSLSSAIALPHHPLRTVHQFPEGTWIENLAVRSNGHILATVMSAPKLYQIDPSSRTNPTLLHTFPNALGLLGITETSPDVFTVISGNFSLTEIKSIPGSYSAWLVDMRVAKVQGGRLVRPPSVSKIADLSDAAFVNGIAPLNQGAVLLADSTLGVVYHLDISSGSYKVIIDDPLMKRISPNVLEGINGMKLHRGTLYFSNTDGGFFAKIPIKHDGTAAGRSSIIARTQSAGYGWDDFAVDQDGTAYAAVVLGNTITKISPLGKTTTIAGNLNSTDVAGPTSAAFGRTIRDQRTLYVATGGGMGAPINGSIIVGGQILAVDVRVR